MIDEIYPQNVFISSAHRQSGYSVHRHQHDQPVPSTLLLDQLAAAAIYKDVQPVLVVTKADWPPPACCAPPTRAAVSRLSS